MGTTDIPRTVSTLAKPRKEFLLPMVTIVATRNRFPRAARVGYA